VNRIKSKPYENDRIKNDCIKSDRIKSGRIKSDRIKTDRIKRITDPNITSMLNKFNAFRMSPEMIECDNCVVNKCWCNILPYSVSYAHQKP
jgi:hypothetical protein